MALIVQKYGGSSLATPALIRSVAARIAQRSRSGDKIIVVVSATGKTTNALETKAYSVASDPDPREMDMLISVGERESVSLMAMAINDIDPGLAVSFTGSQIGLITDNNHGSARILEIKGDRLKQALDLGKIPVIAGFQGVSTEKQITTLGRGGSDTTAVAVAAALKADVCEIYSNVKGVYTADPELCTEAVLIKELDYDSMLVISSMGARVLKNEAVEYAKRLGVRIMTGSAFDGKMGTIISDSVMNRDKIISIISNCSLCYRYFDKNQNIPDNIKKIRYFQSGPALSFAVLDRKAALKEETDCYSVAIAGAGIKSEDAKIRQTLQILKDTNDVIAFDISELKIEFFLKYKCMQNVLILLHSLFFDGKS
ncbi:MAG: aspartate kinase [Candidatus Delongbacteria bacterium]